MGNGDDIMRMRRRICRYHKGTEVDGDRSGSESRMKVEQKLEMEQYEEEVQEKNQDGGGQLKKLK